MAGKERVPDPGPMGVGGPGVGNAVTSTKAHARLWVCCVRHVKEARYYLLGREGDGFQSRRPGFEFLLLEHTPGAGGGCLVWDSKAVTNHRRHRSGGAKPYRLLATLSRDFCQCTVLD